MADDNEHQQGITVGEALRIVALNERSTHGHDFTVLSVLGSGDPRRVICGRCGRSWSVVVGGNGPDLAAAVDKRLGDRDFNQDRDGNIAAFATLRYAQVPDDLSVQLLHLALQLPSRAARTAESDHA